MSQDYKDYLKDEQAKQDEKDSIMDEINADRYPEAITERQDW